MADEEPRAEQQEADCEPDYTQYNEDSVPEPERPIEHTHKGRPDLDYDDTPVGPCQEVLDDQKEEKSD